MFIQLATLLPSLAFAAPPSLVIVATPMPTVPAAEVQAPAEGWTEKGVLQSCSVRWNVSKQDILGVTVGEDCPAESRAAVQKAAEGWSFGAVTPAKGAESVEVRRWFLLETREQDLAWRASSTPPNTPEKPECLQAIRRQVPSFPQNFSGDSDQCLAVVRVDEQGKPAQIEVSECPNSASLPVVDAMSAWKFGKCADLSADQRVFEQRIKFRM